MEDYGFLVALLKQPKNTSGRHGPVGLVKYNSYPLDVYTNLYFGQMPVFLPEGKYNHERRLAAFSDQKSFSYQKSDEFTR
jgi:hypothetical protein